VVRKTRNLRSLFPASLADGRATGRETFIRETFGPMNELDVIFLAITTLIRLYRLSWQAYNLDKRVRKLEKR
jgi:hypothetical protein